jgi:hypothetical protein
VRLTSSVNLHQTIATHKRWPNNLLIVYNCDAGISKGGVHPRLYVEATADARCGLQLLLPRLCSAHGLRQLRQLSLACRDGPCMPQGGRLLYTSSSAVFQLQLESLSCCNRRFICVQEDICRCCALHGCCCCCRSA